MISLVLFFRKSGVTLQWLYTMLQASVPNVSSAFSDVCYNCAYLDVAHISHICLSFIWMFYMFCNDFQVLFICFLQVFQTYVSCVFRSILQMFQLDVSKVDRVLLRGTHPDAVAGAPPSGRRRPGGGSGGGASGGVGWCERRSSGAGPVWVRKTECRRGRPNTRVRSDVWALALPLEQYTA
jgi:hypothetical protein